MNLIAKLYNLNKRYIGDYFVFSGLRKASLKRIADVLATSGKIKVEIGAGAKRHDGWITIDNNRFCDIYWELQ